LVAVGAGLVVTGHGTLVGTTALGNLTTGSSGHGPESSQPLRSEGTSSSGPGGAGGSGHGGGKNAPHANQSARESAKSKYEAARERFETLKAKPKKEAEDVRALEQAKREMNHLKKKYDFTGESHSRKPKT